MGNENKPMLYTQGATEIPFNINDTDGLLYMLDRDFGGCTFLPFSKPMNPDIPGKALLDGEELDYVLKPMALAGGMWMLGVKIFGKLTEYGERKTLRIEGFTDTEGNVMDPVELTVVANDRQEPQEKYAAHEGIALQAAEEGIVLLKNEANALPLSEGTWNVFGKGQHEFRSAIVGAGKINPRYTVNFREAVNGEEQYHLNRELSAFYQSMRDEIPPEEMLKKAREASDTAILIISRASGENMDCSSDRGEYRFSEEEEALLKKLTETFAKTVVVLNTPYPLDVTPVEESGAQALVFCGIGGMLGGSALVNVLCGRTNPSGKLTDTWAKKYEDIPASKNFYDCAGGKTRWDADHDVWIDTVYEEGLYVGYRYFATFDKEPAYPFGFGLSYTSFALTDVTCASDKVDGQETVTVSVKVTNTGKTAGKEVAQLYVKKPDGKLEQPSLELVAFDKTAELAPGESQILTLTASPLILSSYSEEQAAYIREKGTYLFYVGTSSADLTKAGAMEQGEDQIVKQVVNRMQPAERPLELSKRDPEGTYPKGLRSGVKEGVHAFEPKQERPEYPIAITEPVDYVADMSVEEMARLCVCGADGWGMEGIGEAGRMFKIEGYPIPDYIVADGNSGVNLRIPNIGMPTGTTICSSFNRELAREVGKVIGEEAKENGVRMILAPAMNLHRNPLNGRNSEYFSEDPLLAGEMAGNYCLGLEGTGVDGGYKHCIANNCESSRKRNQSIISERAIRELYFKAFEVAMKVHMPKSIMTAYNAVNGVPTSADADLILGLFREENGFDGFVMTDWNSYDTSDVVEMIRSGNNWLTPGTKDDTFTKPLMYAVADGRLSVERLRESASYIARVIGRAE